jgi:hypothetical protein
MPVLENQRHEIFAQEIAKGKTISESYVLAGFKPNRANAARLKAKESVRQRILELGQAGAAAAKVTVESLINELEAARQQATDYRQLSAAIRAIEAKGKIAGVLVERKQIEIIEQDDEAQCAQEVLHRVAERVSVEAAVQLGRCFDVEFDPTWSPDSEPIRAPGISQRLIEERRPIVNGRKRQLD